jgi:hypothetical protein
MAAAERIQARPTAKVGGTLPAEPAPEAAAPAVSRNLFRQEGEYWTVGYEGAVAHLKDAKGLRYLARRLAHPGREFHATDLERAGSQPAQPVPSGARNGPGLASCRCDPASVTPASQWAGKPALSSLAVVGGSFDGRQFGLR